MTMTNPLTLTKRFSKAAALCAVATVGFASHSAEALEISGLIKVNGTEMSGVTIAAYDCADSTYLGLVYSGATDNSAGTPVNFAMSVPMDNVRLELYYTDVPGTPFADQCRAFVNCGEITVADGKATVNFDMTCGDEPEEPEAPGVHGHGFWKTHLNEWPVESLTIGGRTFSKAQILFLMRLPERGDKTRHLFRELLAAKLNVAAGNDDSCIIQTIDAVDMYLSRLTINSVLKASSPQWKRVFPAVKRLADYNDGRLCAPAAENDSRDCDDDDDRDDDDRDDDRADNRRRR